jgi:hypothetical protein
MSIKTRRGVIKSERKSTSASVKEEALALAQLALDIFKDKKQCSGVKIGQNYANHQRKR